MNKNLACAILAGILTVGILNDAYAGEFKPTQQMIVTALIAADWAQTRNIARRDDLHETNPIMGRNPSISEVNRYFLTYALAYNLSAYLLPEKWATRLSITIGAAQAVTVHKNIKIGVKFDF